MSKILVVDDESAFSSGLSEYFEIKGHEPKVAEDLAAARQVLEGFQPDLVLLDLMLPDGSGLELLDDFEQDGSCRFVIMTGHAGVKSLIGSISGSDVSYLKKPIQPTDLDGILAAMGSGKGKRKKAASGDRHFDLILGESPAMQAVYRQIRQVAPTTSTVLIQGESGTGKELAAEAIHRESGREGGYVPVNCGGLNKDMLSSQLFGHEKGAFTGAEKTHQGYFELADGGTLFLDEITEMPMEMQTHLLRVLETGKVQRLGAASAIQVDHRIVAATNRDPQQAVADGKLREDLYYRLCVFPLALPALRERGDDVVLLARAFLDEFNNANGTSKQLDEAGEAQLKAHSWPGNVRELRHLIQRAAIMSEGEVLDLPQDLGQAMPGQVPGVRPGRSIADVEKDLILTTLEHFDGDKNAAAESLGVSLKTLYNRLKSYQADD